MKDGAGPRYLAAPLRSAWHDGGMRTHTPQPDEVVACLRDAGVRFAFLHGSRAQRTHRSDSDLDLAVWLGDDVDELGLRSRLPDGVDLLVLDTAPLELAGRVAMHGLLVLDLDPAARVEWQATTRKLYADERYRVEQARRDFADATVVDAERLARLLRRVTDDATRLQTVAGDTEGLLDEVRLDHVKYRFVTAIDAAQHVCATEGLAAPDTNADAMRRLAQRAILDPPTGEAMARAVGFRNLLLHRYADVDDRLVLAQLGNVAVLDAFVSQLTVRYL